MAGVNVQFIVGNLGADPEVRAVGDTFVCDLRVACTESIKRKGQWEDHTEWFKVVVWGKSAESAGKYLSKGSQVHVQGKTRTEKWQDKDGNDRYTQKVICDRLTFIGSKAGGGGGNSQSQQSQKPGNGQAPDDDIPF